MNADIQNGVHNSSWGIEQKQRLWLADFRSRHGRNPRVLGIGNIANNAFKNAVALRAVGVDCDVLCNDYYDSMAAPEWEAADFDLAGLNLAAPNWRGTDLRGYIRPRWFAQGSCSTCLDYLIAKNLHSAEADALWEQLSVEVASGGTDVRPRHIPEPLTQFEIELVSQRLKALSAGTSGDQVDINLLHYVYQSLFIDKARWNRLLGFYDVAIGYATNGLYPLCAGDTPFIAYEHGTIRKLPFEPTLAGQLCAVVYERASNVLITNCDNIEAAKELKLREFRFVPHAILEDWRHDGDHGALRTRLLDKGKHDFIAFHPSRQHWTPERDLDFEKGNDIFIEGFARFVKTVRPKALLVLVSWGQHVEHSKALIERLGITPNTLWIEPMPIRLMSRYVAASDILADQFVIGAWGALMPIGLMLGIPTMCYVNEDVHRWCFPDMPPVLNASTARQVEEMLVEIVDPLAAQALSRASIAWYDKYHSMSVVAGRLVDAVASATDAFAKRPELAVRLDPPIAWLGDNLVDLQNTNSSLAESHSALQQAHIALGREHYALRQEHNALCQKQGALRQNHDALQQAHVAVLQKHDALALEIGELLKAHVAEMEHRLGRIEGPVKRIRRIAAPALFVLRHLRALKASLEK